MGSIWSLYSGLRGGDPGGGPGGMRPGGNPGMCGMLSSVTSADELGSGNSMLNNDMIKSIQ